MKDQTYRHQLKAAGGNAWWFCGSNDSNIQVVVNAINEAIGPMVKRSTGR